MLRRLLPLLLLAAAACSSGDDAAAPTPTSSSTTTSTTTTTVAPSVTATVDWTARTATVEGTPYVVSFCEGDAPLLCVRSPEGDQLGVIEHAEFDPVEDLAAFAASFSQSMQEDRTVGCDPTYELVPDETTPSTLFGSAGVRYGFTGTIGGVREVERVVAHAANVDGRLHLVTANFLADDGCLSRESELPIDVVADVEPILDAVVAGSTR